MAVLLTCRWCRVSFPFGFVRLCSNWTGPPMAVLLNKSDLVTEQAQQELVDWYKTNCRAEQVRWGLT